MGDKEKGLYEKFRVYRTDGRDEPGEKHDSCEYFVLDLTHDPCAVSAIRAYANACEGRGFFKLAQELRHKADHYESQGYRG